MGGLRVAVTLEQCWHRVPGGTATAALRLVDALQQRASFPASTATAGGSSSSPIDLVGVAAWHRNAPPEPFVPSVPVRHLPLPRRALYESWHRFRRPAVTRTTGPVDVVHATGLAMPPRDAPIVWTLHDLAFLREPGHFTPHGLRFFHAALDLALTDADVVVCSSEATAADARRAGFDEARLRVVPLGADQRRADEARAATVRARHGLARPYVLHVGTAEPRKNLPVLLDAFLALGRSDVDLVLVGPEGWGENVGTRLAAAGDRVRRLGFVTSDDLAGLYAGAAVFCYPSVWEGFGLPVLEALVQGAPVVTSAGTAMAEVAGDAALLVEPTDVGALRDALATILDDAVVRDRLRDAGPRQASSFTWERTAAAVAQAYRAVAA